MNLPHFDKPRRQQPVRSKQRKQKQQRKPQMKQIEYGSNINHLKSIQKEEW